MLKHFGKNARMGYVSADEILEIGNIIRGGELKIVNENERRYTVNDKNYPGRKLTVVVKKSLKKGFPDFVFTFFSNKKAEDVLAKKASGQTLTVLPSSTVKQDLNSFPKSQENFYNIETEADAFEGSSGSYIIDGIGSVDPQGRFTPDRFAADPANIAANARETWDKLKSMLKIADDIEGGTPLELAEKIGSQIELWRTKLDPKAARNGTPKTAV